jgi:hypothetical protein
MSQIVDTCHPSSMNNNNATATTTVVIPPQLRSIIQAEGKARNLDQCMKNIEKAKQNELRAYMSLCDIRLQTIL